MRLEKKDTQVWRDGSALEDIWGEGRYMIKIYYVKKTN